MSTDFSKKNFLVVDDFEKFRTVLKGLIQLCGGKSIELANTGSEAITRIKNYPFDIILCDYHLGQGKNGQQVLEQIRHENLLPESAIFIMVTAESGSEMVMGAIECQPDGYLMKPFNQAMLKSRLVKIVRLKNTLQPIYDALEEGAKEKAIEMCKMISARYPKYVSNVKRIEADLYLDLDDYDNAKSIFETVLGVKPLPWAGLGLGQVYYKTKDYHKAAEIFSDLINNNKLMLQAYDWLAKCYIQLDDDNEAEQVLKQAIALSPKAILRQVDLGNLAYKIGDLDVAESSFREAVKLGRNSCFKSPENYTNLARTLLPKMTSDNETVRKIASDEAFSVLKEVRTDYKNDKKVTIEATLLESQTFTEIKDEAKAKQKLEMASSMYETYGSQLPTDIKIDMAKTLCQHGKKEEAEEIATQIASENQDNEAVLEQLGTFVDTSPLNAEGIALYREGKYLDAIKVFTKACAEFPASISINLNAIQAITKEMQTSGSTPEYIEQCEKYFAAIRKISSDDKRYRRYSELKKLYQMVIKET